MARMIESPTTASAAATTMMKKMKTTPVIESRERAKPMKDRFTAFSINSMLMKMTITLRRNITPRTPIENKRALRMRMWVRGIILIQLKRRLAITTAPITATKRSMEMISKGRTYSVKSSCPIRVMEPISSIFSKG